MVSPNDLKKELISIVGSENLFDDEKILQNFASDFSFVKGKMPILVVKPKNFDHVIKIVRLANEKKVSLTPISSKIHHFRGDTIPTSDESVIVDLSGMKKIIRVDRRNRVAIIEPGVTFGELQEAAAKQGMKVLMPLIPRATKSVLGSYLEREPILIPRHHWDMTDPLLCTEVVFGTGDIFRTGSAAGPGTLEEQWAAGQAQKNPMGPAQTDLVRVIQGSQGTMGIITWAPVKLELLPKLERLFFAQAQSLDELIDFVYRLMWLRMGEECFILNNTNLASILGENAERIQQIREELSPWVLFICVAGFERLPEERLKYQTEDIMKAAQEFHIQLVEEIPFINGEEMLKILSKPSEEPYWKLRLKSGCAELFFLTTLDKSPEMVEIVYEVAESHKYPKGNLGVYIQPVQQGRVCHCEFNIPYNPNDEIDFENSKSFYLKTCERLIERGAFFSRPYPDLSHLVYDKTDENVVLTLRKLKELFDPNGILNPGKLCFWEEA
ncbi:MAG: FAD-binding oxidoreductase [Candidatus Jordarchaeum sp.]|uniref:FAD-binding oxidoreductase n=1 Tax=Candidatus Jordarchaeum sp. TaxID=2823881 RepID=UPI00404B3EC9